MRKLIVTLLSLAFTTSAAAQDSPFGWMQPQDRPGSNRTRMSYMTGNQFIAQCQNSKVACSTYIQGVNDALLSASEGTDRDVPYCIPNAATIDQITDIVLAFLERHPEHRHERAPKIIVAALRSVWPQCEVGPT